MILSTLRMQIIQLRRQLDMRLFSRCYYTQPEVDILARRNRLDMNQEYSFFLMSLLVV